MQPPPAWTGWVVEPCRKIWDGPKHITIVGSTGSIGTQTLDIFAENLDKFKVVALAVGSNETLFADQETLLWSPAPGGKICPCLLKKKEIKRRNGKPDARLSTFLCVTKKGEGS